MPKRLIALLALVAFVGSLSAKTTKSAKARSSRSASHQRSSGRSSSRAHAKTSARSRAHGKSSSKSKGRRTARSTPRRTLQSAPAPERYREIQQALADKGYYKGTVDGNWGADSVDALKRFQADQKLEPDGKLGSLSLIALGLGPKRLTAQAKPGAPSKVPDPQTKIPQ